MFPDIAAPFNVGTSVFAETLRFVALRFYGNAI
jgi:hypothetical protein